MQEIWVQILQEPKIYFKIQLIKKLQYGCDCFLDQSTRQLEMSATPMRGLKQTLILTIFQTLALVIRAKVTRTTVPRPRPSMVLAMEFCVALKYLFTFEKKYFVSTQVEHACAIQGFLNIHLFILSFLDTTRLLAGFSA